MKTLPYDWDAAVRRLRRADPRLRDVIDRSRGVRLEIRRMRSPFEYLLRAIIFQQLSGKAASTIHGRFLDLFPRRRPTASRLLALRPTRLRAAGVSAGKQTALRDLARRADRGEVPGFATLERWEDERIVEELTQVHGVGRWTVEMLLMFQLGRPDVLPVGDLGVRKGYARIVGSADHPTPSELERGAEAWRPHRSVASWYCWRACELPGQVAP